MLIHIIFIYSIGLILAASFVLYHEHISYNQRVKRYAKTVRENAENIGAIIFATAEVDVLENYREQRNVLPVHKAFLKRSVINCNPSNFSYANLLKGNLITQLDCIKFTQPYWDTIITSFYTDISSGNDIPLSGYKAIKRILMTYVYNNIKGVENNQIREKNQYRRILEEKCD